MPSPHRFVLLILLLLHKGLALRNALSSHPPLRCCFMEEPPISFQNSRNNWNNGLDGVIKEHLLQHQSYLNWTCSSMLPFRHSDGTDFNAFVSAMHQCTNKSTGQVIQSPQCQCDIGIGGWFQNPARFGKVTFLPPFGYDRYVVFTHVSQATVSGKRWFFLQTFDASAWICIVAMFVMFTLLKMLDQRFEPDAQYTPLPSTTSRLRRRVHFLTKSRPLYRLRKATQSTGGSTTRQWFLNMILAVASLFLILSYEASMTASLVQESIETRFHSAADLQNCRIEPSEICILRGGAFETYWNVSIAVGKCHMQNPPQLFSSYETLYEAVENGRCSYAIVIESAITSAIRERFCGHFVIVGEPIFNGGLSMLLPIGSKLTENMSLTTLALQGNQTEPSLSKYFNTLPRCEAEMNSMLSFDKLRLFFVILFSLGAIILLAMVLIPQHSFREGASTQTRSARSACTEQILERKKMPVWDAYGGEAREAALGHDWLAHRVGIGAQYSQFVRASRADVLTYADGWWDWRANCVELPGSMPWVTLAPDSESDEFEADSGDKAA